ncbi:putative quinol monooxygenase [Maricaulis sp.]|uniref:putative quinol monooxygenase n=1 Tax=Maricaulis sp. TaxID=1486257 RepID=UPI0026374A37|nr:putative quinol monooxygenase [Maricaulis sp.]
MSDFHIVAGLVAKPGTADQLRNDILAVVEASRKEEGNLAYDLFESLSEPGQFVLIEHWASEADQQRHHNEGPHIQHFHANGDANVEKREFFRALRKLT